MVCWQFLNRGIDESRAQRYNQATSQFNQNLHINQRGRDCSAMNVVTASVPDVARASTSMWLESFSFCPSCLTREFFRPADRDRTWMHCSQKRTAIRFIDCPSCGRNIEFLGQTQCPSCQARFTDGVPLQPYIEPKTVLDRLLRSRGEKHDRQSERANAEFAALYASWRQESTDAGEIYEFEGTRFSNEFREVHAQHHRLLADFAADVDKFLYGASVRLAKFETEYSWKFDQEVGREVDQLLEGMLRGRHAVAGSLPFLARCRQRFPQSYSRQYLVAELKRRLHERRQAPRPDFQQKLEYASRLSGLEFEEWLARLLRDAGIGGVCLTQASRDQGADLVITIGNRKIVMQAKQYQETVGNSAVQEVHGALPYYGATEAWVVTTSSFSKDAIDLAYRTGVRLVSGNQLLNLPAMLREGNSDPSEPDGVADQDFGAPAEEIQTEIAPAGPAIARGSAAPNTADLATLRVRLQRWAALSVLRNWEPRQMYFAGAAITVLLIVLVAGLTSDRVRRSGYQDGTAQPQHEMRKRVPTTTLPRSALRKHAPVTVSGPPSESEPIESSVQETKPTGYVPIKYTQWYTLEANGEITVPNSTYTHLHVISNAPVRVRMNDCQKEGKLDFECDSRAGAVTVKDLSGTAGTRVLVGFR